MRKALVVTVALISLSLGGLLAGCDDGATGTSATPDVTVNLADSGGGETPSAQSAQSAYCYDVELVVADEAVVVQQLMAGKSVTGRSTYSNPETTTTVIEASDGALVSIESTGSTSFHTPFAQSVNTVLGLDTGRQGKSGKLRELSSDEALAFCSADEAVADVKGILASFGFSDFGETEVFALRHTLLADAEDQIRQNPDYQGEIAQGLIEFKDSWDTADDCYYLAIETEVDGIAFVSDSLADDKTMTFSQGGRIEVIYSSAGVQQLYAPALYRHDPATGTEVSLLGRDEVVEALKENLEYLIMDNSYEIVDASLRYFARYRDETRSTMQIIPVWEVMVNETPVDTTDERGTTSAVTSEGYAYYLDATTGQEILSVALITLAW
jgi:hypothetical protein